MAAICYVLQHIQPFDLEAQDVYQPTGVKYLCRVSTVRERILLLVNWDDPSYEQGNRVGRADVEEFDKKMFEKYPFLKQRE